MEASPSKPDLIC